MLAALGHEQELALHIRATRNTGATIDEIHEVLMQVAIYAGIPAANAAFRVAKDELGSSKRPKKKARGQKPLVQTFWSKGNPT